MSYEYVLFPLTIFLMSLSIEQQYHYGKRIAAMSHGKINCAGGNIFQHEIFLAIKESGKHLDVQEEYQVKLVNPGKRKHHKVDILVVDDDIVLCSNSKGKSFNNTDSEDAKLNDVRHFVQSVQAVYPDKKVVYQFLKDEWYDGKKGQELYDYLKANGVPVHNTEEYLRDNYGIDFDAVEFRRQKECVKRFSEVFAADPDNTAIIEWLRSLVPVQKPAQRRLKSSLDLL